MLGVHIETDPKLWPRQRTPFHGFCFITLQHPFFVECWATNCPVVVSCQLITPKTESVEQIEYRHEPTNVSSRTKQEMVGKEFQTMRLVLRLQPVQFDSFVVVNIDVLPLSCCPV